MYQEGEDSGVSTVVGAVLILVILLVLLSLYQVYGVPSENRETEFKHSQDVRGDFLDARNAVLDAKRTGRGTSASVRLAPQYPTRLFGINPPPPTGTVETTDNGTIEVRDQANSLVDACPVTDQTRMLEYEAAYNEYRDGPTMRYENTVAYADYDEATRLLSEQKLVEGRTVNLVVLQPEFSETGTGVASFEPRPGGIVERRVNSPTVTVPTELGEDDWEGLLDGEVDAGDVDVTDGELTVELDGVHTVSCGVVGTRGAPPGGGRGDAGDGDVNPAGPGSVSFVGGEILGPGGGPPGQQASRDVRLTFENNADEDATVTEARIAFYYQSPQPARADITEADLYDSPTPPTNFRANLVILNPAVEVTPPVVFEGDSQTDISLRFDVRPHQNDFFVMRLTFEDGRTGLYFVSMS